MSFSTSRRGFTLVELLVVIAIIGTLVGLLLPAVQQAREAARRSACTNNLKQLALSCLNYESTRKRLPSANDRDNGSAGWSWLVHVLPFIEEVNMHTNLASATSRFASGYTSGQTLTGSGSVLGDILLPQITCPSASWTNPNRSYASGVQALTNYKSASGVQLVSVGVPVSTDATGGGVVTQQTWQPLPTGATSGAVSLAGINLRQVSDGMAKSLMLAESCEDSAQSAWPRGLTSWVAASDQTNGVLANGTWTTIPTKKIGKDTLTTLYTGDTRGASSFHSAGLVMHAYADGHTTAMSLEIDPGVLCAVYSRAGGETTTELP